VGLGVTDSREKPELFPNLVVVGGVSGARRVNIIALNQ
jgi:hypothetical protein